MCTYPCVVLRIGNWPSYYIWMLGYAVLIVHVINNVCTMGNGAILQALGHYVKVHATRLITLVNWWFVRLYNIKQSLIQYSDFSCDWCKRIAMSRKWSKMLLFPRKSKQKTSRKGGNIINSDQTEQKPSRWKKKNYLSKKMKTKTARKKIPKDFSLHPTRQ